MQVRLNNVKTEHNCALDKCVIKREAFKHRLMLRIRHGRLRNIAIQGLYLYWIGRTRRLERAKSIFVQTWMRTGSTWLTDIITASKSVVGCGELGHIYNSQRDLLAGKMLINLFAEKSRTVFPYYLDKICHSRLTPNCQIYMPSKNQKFIILLRDPRRSLASILRGNGLFGFQSNDLAGADEYIRDRIRQMTRLVRSESACGNLIGIEYEDMVNDFGGVVHRLNEFLELDNPISGARRLPYWFDGIAGFGDPESVVVSHARRQIVETKEPSEALMSEYRALKKLLEAL